ncbi:SusC/RagA family TonB-linked outer membrane protein [Flavobacterium sp. ZT3R18]|uniref:SusC/RagA family TonB-linked outer membrane protein n=1 Tax=Flavobacterium sp. ZT3R18 TaxID=2594429 RepID=UPI00117A78DB|nr:SusC/RagA family TonB-linked outer membrane protein [Flavobacterium sp. ZT3R18]TRX35279.1 SusC/RagA family TonB-linked outer membrane protein [Flavobacterium sp. ZT3R18]
MKTIYRKLLFLVLLLPFCAIAQNKVDGIVLDNVSGQPIPGVNVKIEGSSTGTSTGFDGKFQLTNVKPTDMLNISYMGYVTKKITVGSQNAITIKLEEDSSQLKEVVVQVGYGSVKKKDATGAVTVLGGKDFNKGLNVTSENLITGRVAGVSITGGGAPGAKSDIRIRGGSSLNASNEPLIVVDGLPLSGTKKDDQSSVLSTIDPNDIETFTILKDASASAIYGSRAANGVIVITTKKGAKGGVKVAFNSQTGVSTIAKKINVLSADEFRTLVNANGSAAQKAKLGTANTDWQNEIFSDVITSNNNISISGSLFDKLPTRLSVGNTNTPGILKNTSFERTTTSLSLNPVLLDNHLKIDLSGNLSFVKNQFQDEGSVISSAIVFDPTQSVYQAGSRYGGYFEWLEANGDVNLLALKNPVARINQNNRRSTSTRKWGNARIDYKMHFLEELRAVAELGIDRSDNNGYDETSTNSVSGYQPNTFSSGKWVNLGNSRHYTDSRQNKNLNAYLNYAKEFDKFKVDLTGGYNYQLFQRVGYSTGEVIQPNPAEDVTTDPDINLQSYFGRANVGYDSRYLLTLSYRRDGTSRFSEENRWGNFASAAFAWNIAEESFLKDNKTISALKLRAGYGTTGQQDITASYDYLRRVTLGTVKSNYVFGSTAYQVAKTEGYNADIKWETATEFNVGLDFGFLDNRINGTINYFNKKASDLLADIAYPDGANLRNSGFSNIGSVTTDGIEFNVNVDVLKKDNLNWNVGFNMAYLNQEITDLGETVPGFQGYMTGDNIAGGSNNKIKINSVGFNPSSFYVYEQLYDANKKPIQGAYVDRDGDGKITASDKYRFHKPNADYTFGLFSTFNYKKFDFAMSWRASLGNFVFDNISSDKGYLQAALRRDTDLANITPDYYETGFTFEDNGTTRYASDYFVKDASFIKLDNVSVGYTMDKSVLKLVALHFSLGVQNALVFSKYNGIDPESFSGVDGSVYPRARTYMFGVNANF